MFVYLCELQFVLLHRLLAQCLAADELSTVGVNISVQFGSHRYLLSSLCLCIVSLLLQIVNIMTQGGFSVILSVVFGLNWVKWELVQITFCSRHAAALVLKGKMFDTPFA